MEIHNPSLKSSVLIVSFIGYTPQEFTINGNQTFYQISLAEDTQTLDEVVVVGFGTQKKVNLTGAVATVDKKHWNHVLSLQFHKLFKE